MFRQEIGIAHDADDCAKWRRAAGAMTLALGAACIAVVLLSVKLVSARHELRETREIAYRLTGEIERHVETVHRQVVPELEERAR